MATLPYSRVVRVTLTRDDKFPDRRGFGIPLFLTPVTKTGKLTADLRTRAYGSMEEVAVDWLPTDEFYKAAMAAFSQNPRPVQIKVGYINATTTSNAAAFQTELNSIETYDAQFYWIDIDKTLRDIAGLDGVVNWIETKNRFAIITSNDVNTESVAITTSLAARQKGKLVRSAVFYSQLANAAEYPGYAYAALLGTFNFDNADAAYTGKFKKLLGITPANLGSTPVQQVTGFQPQLGQSTAAGNCANMFINIGGQNFVVEGSTLTPNVFIDEIHATDWIIARTEEEMLGVLLNNNRVPFTDAGMEMLASAARVVMTQAIRAGLIAIDLDENGDYSPAVEYIVPSVFDVPASQRKARIAPEIIVRFRYAGAVHYAQVNYRMTF